MTHFLTFFTESGQVAIPELEARTVSISLEHLRTRPVRLVVAGGNVKMRALDTALRMGDCDASCGGSGPGGRAVGYA